MADEPDPEGLAEGLEKLFDTIEEGQKTEAPLKRLSQTILQFTKVVQMAAPILGRSAKLFQQQSGKPLPTVTVPAGSGTPQLPAVWNTPTSGKPPAPEVKPASGQLPAVWTESSPGKPDSANAPTGSGVPPRRYDTVFQSGGASTYKPPAAPPPPNIRPPSDTMAGWGDEKGPADMFKGLEKAKGGVDALGDSLGKLSGAASKGAGPMAVLSETITKGMEKAKEVIKKVVETAQAMHASFQKVSSTLTETVGAFNPAAVMRFEGALADLTAVAGQILLPALEKMTEVVREVGKWFYNLDPGTKKLIATLAAAGAAVAALGSAMVVIGPIVATITAAFTALAPVIGPPAAALFVLTGGFGLLKKNATDAKGPLETLRNIFNSLQDAIKPVVDAVQKSVLPAIQKMMDAINTAGQGLGGRIAAGIAAMQPAFDSIGRSISGLADQFAKLLPSLVELGSAFLELVTSGIGPTIVVLAELATGSLALFIEMLKPTIAWVKLLVDSMTAWYQAIMDVAKALKLLPKGGPTGAPSKGRDKDPMGLAVRPASYVGIEELGAQAQLAAYSSGSAKNERQLLEEGNNARTKAEERTHQILLAMAEKMGAVAENTQSKDPAGALNAVKGK